MMVPAYNGTANGLLLAGTGITLPSRQWREVPLEVALRHSCDQDIVYDWQAAREQALDREGETRHINLISPLSPMDGYGLVGIHAIQALESRGFTVHLSLNQTRWASYYRDHYPWMEGILHRPMVVTKWGLAHVQPFDFFRLIAARKVGWTMWECTRLPIAWKEHFDLIEQLIVPTKGQLAIFRDSGLKLPITVIPDGIDFEAFEPIERPERDTFTFITWGRLSSRKCPAELVHCFTRGFPAQDYPAVRLILKTRKGDLGMGQIMPRFGDSRIRVINAEWDLGRLVSLCHETDCAVFISHGEGFGQPAVQAMATGLPVILSNHSGQSDFADERYNYPIGLDPKTPYTPSPMGDEFGEKLSWWEPDLDQTIEAMRHVYHHQEEARAKGQRAAAWVRRRFSIPAMATKLAKLLRELD
jgi:glycosyltransferase involved in cell wall biosynthesis